MKNPKDFTKYLLTILSIYIHISSQINKTKNKYYFVNQRKVM